MQGMHFVTSLFQTFQSQAELVAHLKSCDFVTTPQVEAVLQRVDRRLFVSASNAPFAYADSPLEIGHKATISAPHMVRNWRTNSLFYF